MSLHIKENLSYVECTDLNVINEFIESIFIEVDKKVTDFNQNVIIGTIYRPPNTKLDCFNNYMYETLSKIKLENKLVYLMGDFNVNLLNSDNHSLTSEFLDLMYSFSLLPLINKPTRIHKNGVSLIDNIYSNNLNNLNNKPMINGIFYTDISDHLPIFSINLDSTCIHSENCFFYIQKATE